jgi:phosphatidylserine/phosphatidylglycerophosphate/cardiolipin synthase-like enzyme
VSVGRLPGSPRRLAAALIAVGFLAASGCGRVLPRWSAAPTAEAQAVPPGRGDDEGLRHAFESLAGGHPHQARIELLDDNVEAWAARWRLLAGARETIDADYFILSQDVFGIAFLGHLLERARDGVRVRLLLDAQGLRVSERPYDVDCLAELARAPNVSVRIHRSMGRRLLDAAVRLDPLVATASDHDKIMVVDRRLGVVGGRNVDAKYFAHPDDAADAFHDVDVVVESAALGEALTRVIEGTWESDRVTTVAGARPEATRCEATLHVAYETMDAWLAGRPFPDQVADAGEPRVPLVAELQRLPRLRGAGRRGADRRTTVEAHVVDSVPRAGSAEDAVTRSLERLIGAAARSVLIESPYVVLTREAAATLEAAGHRGVAVTLITNSPVSTDNAVSQAYFNEQWPRLLAAVPELRLYAAGTRHNVHSKLAVFDDRAVLIGSYNLDPFSMLISGEVVVAVWSPAFARRVAERPRRTIAAGPPGVYEYTIERDAGGRPLHTATGEVAIGFGPGDHSDGVAWPRPGVRMAFVRAVPWLFGLPPFF